MRFDYLAVEMLWSFGMLYLYRQEDNVRDDLIERAVENLPLYATGPGMEAWWWSSGHRSEYPSDFAEAVDRIFSDEGRS